MGAHDTVYLDAYLAPVADILSQKDVTDIYINKPGEIWIERLGGGIEQRNMPSLDHRILERLSRQIAAITHQGINREYPLLAATLPDGSRVQIVMPPATRGSIAIAIRKHVVADISLSDYERDGSFSASIGRIDRENADRDNALGSLLNVGKYSETLALGVRQRRNILISGGTSTGKTTFLNALLREIPTDERLIVIEDTPELQLRHANAIGLVAPRSELGETAVDTDDLLNASLRMRPDRIILGEIRGREAYTFLRSINTGHPGSMSTVHADSPDRAVEQLALLVLQTGTRLNRADVVEYIQSTIDIFVQLGRNVGRRKVTNIRLNDRIHAT